MTPHGARCAPRAPALPLPLPLPLLPLLLLLLHAARCAAAPFGAGNLVALRVGDGTAALTTAAAALFLDELTPGASSAAAVQSLAAGLTVSGSDYNMGLMSRSADGQFLVVAASGAAPGALVTTIIGASSATRVIARVNASAFIDSSTALTFSATGNNGLLRGACLSGDGSGFVVTQNATQVRKHTPHTHPPARH